MLNEHVLNEHDIFNLLIKAEDKIKINWQQSILKGSELANKAVKILLMISNLREYRAREKREGLKRTPIEKLEPLMMLRDASVLEVIFDYNEAVSWLKKILNIEFSLPDNLETDIDTSINYALTLRAVYNALIAYSGDAYPTKMIYWLNNKLLIFMGKVIKLRDQILAEERIGDRNSQNASTRTPARIDDYKKHEKYPELEQMIKLYEGTQKELRKINKLMAAILETENKVTIRRYRHLFFQNLQK